MKHYIFHKQAASEECPAVPRTVKVAGESMVHAMERLAATLKADPELKNGTDHLLVEEKREVKPAKKAAPTKKPDAPKDGAQG